MHWYDPGSNLTPSPEAFRPKVRDKTGLSLFRANFVTPEKLAQNDRNARFYVAILCERELRELGLEIIPKPNPTGPPGHCEIPELRYENRRETRSEEFQVALATMLCVEILGPLPTS
ncbi:MAG: hypothetical protein HYR83_09540 [Planctomycetes bacterium]|nr:hypothetical protein [Planctomycetota bacterium]